MKFLRLPVWVLAIMLSAATTRAQQPVAKGEAWSLQRCIDQAVQNNLQVRQSELQSEQARLSHNRAKGNMLPNINGNASHSYNFGRSIDPATNQFIDQRIQSNNFSLNGNLVLFAGLQRQNTLKQNQLEHEASRLDVETTRNNIMLQVVTAYLQILFAEELLQTSDLQLSNTREQLTRAEKLFKAGSVAESNVIELQAQAAQDELNIITAQNQRDQAVLALAQLMNLQDATGLQIVRPDIPAPSDAALPASPQQVYETALISQPQIKSAELRTTSSIRGVEIARGGYYPTLSLFGNVFTLYSSARERFQLQQGPPQTQTIGTIQGPDGPIPVTAQVPNTFIVYSPYNFNDQLRDNVSKSFGLSLNIPILNGFQARNNTSRAHIMHQNARLQSDMARQQLYQDIQRAFADARAAEKRHAAATRQLTSFEQAFRNAQKRFDQGVMNSTDFNVTKNNFTRAQSDLIQAKYDYLFRVKVLDFYQGKPIVL